MSGGIGNTNKFLSIYASTKLNKSICVERHDDDPLKILAKAKRENALNRFNDDIYYCIYNTVIDGKDAVIIIFTLMLPGPVTGSSKSSEIVMNIVKFLESKFMTLDHNKYLRNIDNKNKGSAILVVKKKLDENDKL